MKKFLSAALVLIVSAVSSRGEVESLLDQGTWGMWIRPEVGITRLGSETVELAGLQVGVGLNRSLFLGLGYGALVGPMSYGTPKVGELDPFDLWYTGAVLGYSVKSARLVHVDTNLLIGGGRVTAGLKWGGGDKADLFVFDPSIAVLVNVTPAVELGLGVGWRLVSSSGVEGLDEGDLSGVKVGLVLRCTETK